MQIAVITMCVSMSILQCPGSHAHALPDRMYDYIRNYHYPSIIGSSLLGAINSHAKIEKLLDDRESTAIGDLRNERTILWKVIHISERIYVVVLQNDVRFQSPKVQHTLLALISDGHLRDIIILSTINKACVLDVKSEDCNGDDYPEVMVIAQIKPIAYLMRYSFISLPQDENEYYDVYSIYNNLLVSWRKDSLRSIEGASVDQFNEKAEGSRIKKTAIIQNKMTLTP